MRIGGLLAATGLLKLEDFEAAIMRPLAQGGRLGNSPVVRFAIKSGVLEALFNRVRSVPMSVADSRIGERELLESSQFASDLRPT
jgi:hypothetical protein